MDGMDVGSWSGEGIGTGADSFLRRIAEMVPDQPPRECAHAVFCALADRISGGLVRQIAAQLTPDTRALLEPCIEKPRSASARAFDKDEFYLEVAEHLGIEPDDVRRILHGVFVALHEQITEAESERIAPQLPENLSGTWLAARRLAGRPA